MPRVPVFLRPRSLLHIFLCFSMPWFIIDIITSLYARQFNALYFIYFLLVGVVFFFFGLLIAAFSHKDIHFSLPKILVFIVVLCVVDLGIKTYFVNNPDVSIVFVKDWLAIKVVQNTYGSFVFSLFDKKIPDLFVLPALLALYVIFRELYFYQKKGKLFLFWIGFILLCTSFICRFFDDIIHGGSYDYIYLYQMVYTNITDIYLMSGISTIFLSCIYDKNWQEIKQYLRRDPWGKEYYKYELDTWRSIITKIFTRKK